MTGPVQAGSNGNGFTPAHIRWYNSATGAKIGCVNGKYEAIAYGSVSNREFHAEGRPPHPEHGQFQWGFACSPSTLTIGLDGDYTELWPTTATGKYLGPWRDVATSVRELDNGTDKFHIMVIVPPELVHLWPRQLPADFGHIKSNGFTYIEGVHATGTEYRNTGRAWVTADEGLMQALLEDNGGVLHGETTDERNDDFYDVAGEWRNPDGEYPAYLGNVVLGNWDEGTRNDSLPARCGIIKAAGEQGDPGMGTLFCELCAEYDAETSRGDSDVYRAFGRCFPAYGKVNSLSSAELFGNPPLPPALNGTVPGTALAVPAGLEGASPEYLASLAVNSRATRYSQLEAALLDADGLSNIPPPEPLVSGLLYRDSLAWIGGKPGNGKSFAAVDLGCCVSTGHAWHGHPVTRGPVLYVIAEGAAGLSPRVSAWAALNGRKAEDIWFLPVRVQVPNTTDLDALALVADRLEPVLIVLDTQAKVSVGLDENSAQDMGEFVDRLEYLRERTGACVLTIHHQPRNADNLRGSTALEGAANTIISAEKDGALVVLTVTKQKDAPAGPPDRLVLQPSGQSAALTSSTGATVSTLPASAVTVLDTLRTLGGDASTADVTGVTGLSVATVKRAWAELTARGQARREGTPSRPRYVLADHTAADAKTAHGASEPVGSDDVNGSTGSADIEGGEPVSPGKAQTAQTGSSNLSDRLTAHHPIGGELVGDRPINGISRGGKIPPPGTAGDAPLTPEGKAALFAQLQAWQTPPAELA